MNAQQLANAIGPLLQKVNVPMTIDNARATVAIYETLDAMARGELILTRPVAISVPDAPDPERNDEHGSE